jgi:hypothetical protein
MIPGETEARIRAEIWQAIAETDLDLSSLDKKTRSALVDLVTFSALNAVDQELGGFLEENQERLDALAGDELETLDEEEKIIWEGRPLLSIAVHYLITDQRIRVSQGFLSRTYQNVELVRVEDIDHKQSFGERILNRGDIEVRSHDPNSPIIILENIFDPEEVYQILRSAVRNARKDQGLTFQEEM